MSIGGALFVSKSNVGVNTNNPTTPLHVVGSATGFGDQPDYHMALIENKSTTTSDLLALKIGKTEAPESGNNFITFFKGDDVAVGSIEGDGSGGITLNSPGADFAEYFPKLNPSVTIEKAELVGAHQGKISRNTVNADKVFVVSSAPVVLGNSPAEGDKALYVPVALLGQAPVLVAGQVKAGDCIVASGKNDGRGVAVSKNDLDVRILSQVAGVALEDKEGGVGKVNCLVGASDMAGLAALLQNKNNEINALQKKSAEKDLVISRLESRVSRLEESSAPILRSGVSGVAVIIVLIALALLIRKKFGVRLPFMN
jgi:hypothetical protein